MVCLSTRMPTVYKGQHSMLCPYYVRMGKKVIVCNGSDGEVRLRFGSAEEREKFQQHHCYFASPTKCENYMEHRKKVDEGSETPLKPRDSMDTKWKKYHTEWTRKRREDPNYPY